LVPRNATQLCECAASSVRTTKAGFCYAQHSGAALCSACPYGCLHRSSPCCWLAKLPQGCFADKQPVSLLLLLSVRKKQPYGIRHKAKEGLQFHIAEQNYGFCLDVYLPSVAKARTCCPVGKKQPLLCIVCEATVRKKQPIRSCVARDAKTAGL